MVRSEKMKKQRGKRQINVNKNLNVLGNFVQTSGSPFSCVFSPQFEEIDSWA